MIGKKRKPSKSALPLVLSCAIILMLGCASPVGAFAQSIRVAAAADLQQALPDLVQAFRTKYPNARVDAVYGSSGNFVAQIESGAPFDIFFSADMRYPENLFTKGLTTSKPRRYGLGKLVLWVGKNSSVKFAADAQHNGLTLLNSPHLRRLAIANPAHAPYGERAKEALQASKLWNAVEKRLVLAENVAQAAQFAQTLNVDAAIISLSLALSPAMQKAGSYALIDAKLHKPLEQCAVVLKRSVHLALADEFLQYICSPEGAAILARYGFSQ